MRTLASVAVVFVFLLPTGVFAQSYTSGTDHVLRGIPTIAKAFAPLAGVNWQDFARVLASICAVESRCNPNYPHYTQSGAYSQYQGLFQMNVRQVALAEGELVRMLPQIRQLAQAGTISPDVLKFIEDSVREGERLRSTQLDRRFHPSYGIILGAVKHIQLNKQLATRYPGLPYHQAAGHMTAQFSGVTEGKIRQSRFTAPVSGAVNQVNTEAWALGLNRVMGQGLLVQDAIESARTAYSGVMQRMVARMAQVTGNLSLELRDVAPFTVPAYRPGSGPLLDVPHSGVSTLMEAGLIRPQLAPSIPQGGVPMQPTHIAPQTAPNPGTPASVPTSAVNAVPFAATILVQPEKQKPGSTVLLAWTSIGMKPESCVITEKDVEVARGTEGTKRIVVPPSAVRTTVYKLSCGALSGTNLPIVREAEVTVAP